MRLKSCIPPCIAALTLVSALANAQDTRTVKEPKRPTACTTLDAELQPLADTTLAEGDERRLDTRRIQRAIDACPAGKAVILHADGAKRAFLSGPLTLKRGVTLVVDTNVTLFASRDPREYDAGAPGICGTVDRKGHGCRPLIIGEHTPGIGIMGPGTIDGRGWARLLGRDVSWWDLAQQARAGGHQNCPRLIQFTFSDDVTMYDVRLKNSPNFHVVFDRGNGFTAWGVIIDTRDPRARNTDGIDPASATNVTITRSFINTGDDNVAIKAGSTGPSTHMTISHDHFYRGHGMSIGSETNGGASAIRVEDLSVDGADNGLRIKSNAARGGLVQNVLYRDICIRRTKNPIFMDTHYSASEETEGTLVPMFRGIGFKEVRVLGGGTVTLDGYDANRRLGVVMDDVIFDTPSAIKVEASHVDIEQGPGPFNLSVTGDDIRVTGATSDAPANACTGKFADLPSTVASAATATRGDAAIVDAKYSGREGALVDGVATFRSLGDALVNLPSNGVGRAVIFLRNARYHEKLTVDRPYITIRGESRDSTILTYDAASGTPSPGGGNYGTRGSFTLRIVAPDFRAENLTIENAFDYPANAAKAADDPTRVRDAQGVALMLDMSSDRASFENVKITGYQDTLFPNAGRAYFHECEVRGNVDFIFGAGQVVFDDCDIVSRDRGSSTSNGYVTAPSTATSSEYGFVFFHSRLKKERPQMAASSVALGRPWHPYAKPDVSSEAVFIDCWMDDHIGTRGWDRMSSVDSTGTRTWNLPENARFYEFGTTGPGAVSSPSRRLLTAEQARHYAPALVLGGWLPMQ